MERKSCQISANVNPAPASKLIGARVLLPASYFLLSSASKFCLALPHDEITPSSDFMASAVTSSKAKQKHVTTACLNCRTRKIKCNAAIPSCSNCLLYAQQCIYQQGLDKRKIPIKERLVAAEAYAKQLEKLLQANGIALPLPERAQAPAALTEVHGSPAFPPTTSNRPFNEANVLNSGFDPGSSPARLYSPPLDSPSPLVDQITGSLGSLQLAEDGQLRFYGATSNLHILTRKARKTTTSYDLAYPDEIQGILQAAHVDDFVDPDLEEHLIKLYFCWEDPSIHFVREDVFYRERQRCKSEGGTSKLYSEVLVNAMCAVGASLTPRRCEGLPESLVDFFASRARALLDVELDAPTLSTVQSLGILSGVESIRTLDARGWLYSGMAVRLSIDLGLHLDSQAYLDAGIIDHEEAVIRRIVFWGAFIHERMWSLYLGRPVSLDEKVITAPQYAASATEQKYWRLYIDDDDGDSFPLLIDPIEELHRFNASLCAKMTRVRDTLYSDVANLGAQQLQDFASNMRCELSEWYQSLPNSLLVDMASISNFYVPHVIQLHMQYHTLMILVNRPFFAATTTTMPDVAFSDPKVGRPACTESARSISKLLQLYRRLYSLRRINIQAVHLIFTASLVHVLNACEAAEQSLRNSAWKDLEVCQQALSELGKGFQSASRALEVVNNIKRELLGLTRKSTKRSAPCVPTRSNAEITPKRRCSTVLNHATDIGFGDFEIAQDDTILSPSTNLVDSIFWSELMSLDFPKL